eukprot:COSAG06_NODE_34_length_31045_cov_28.806469_4_plen_437_part_00
MEHSPDEDYACQCDPAQAKSRRPRPKKEVHKPDPSTPAAVSRKLQNTAQESTCVLMPEPMEVDIEIGNLKRLLELSEEQKRTDGLKTVYAVQQAKRAEDMAKKCAKEYKAQHKDNVRLNALLREAGEAGQDLIKDNDMRREAGLQLTEDNKALRELNKALYEKIAILEEKTCVHIKHVTEDDLQKTCVIQAAFRGFLARRKYAKIRNAALKIRNAAKRYLLRKNIEKVNQLTPLEMLTALSSQQGGFIQDINMTDPDGNIVAGIDFNGPVGNVVAGVLVGMKLKDDRAATVLQSLCRTIQPRIQDGLEWKFHQNDSGEEVWGWINQKSNEFFQFGHCNRCGIFIHCHHLCYVPYADYGDNAGDGDEDNRDFCRSCETVLMGEGDPEWPCHVPSCVSCDACIFGYGGTVGDDNELSFVEFVKKDGMYFCPDCDESNP